MALSRWRMVQYWDIDIHGVTDAIKGSKVFLNGEEQRSVMAFHVDQGWVRRLALNVDGQAQVDPADDGRVLEETVRGEVTWLPG